MDNIEHFTEIRKGFENLQYNDNNELDRLSRRLSMFIKNIHGKTSEYLDEFYCIRFRPVSVLFKPDNGEEWEKGRIITINLINTIIDEFTIFKNNDVTPSILGNRDKELSKVFIVHGHDDGAKNEVARFVEKLGFEAIILHEQVDSSATIIEKLEKHTDVGFAIVLYTECDIGGVIKSKPEELRPRARQNVIFEHGLLIGKIGRANVVALVKGNVEIPNDISGVVYKSMDTSGAWKYSIAREMKSSGYDVDMNKIA